MCRSVVCCSVLQCVAVGAEPPLYVAWWAPPVLQCAAVPLSSHHRSLRMARKRRSSMLIGIDKDIRWDGWTYGMNTWHEHIDCRILLDGMNMWDEHMR